MEALIQVSYSGNYRHILTEVTKSQRQIMESLKLTRSIVIILQEFWKDAFFGLSL
jgi:hypothetical protein